MITSHQNPLVKSTLRLRSSSHRKKQGRFLIDGIREIQLALKAGVSIETVFCSPEQKEVLDRPALGHEVEITSVSQDILAKLSYGDRSDVPLAVAKTLALPLSKLSLTSQSLVLILDRTEKPGNLGACLRTALACSIDAVVLTQPICDIFNPNVIRASRGTVFQLPIAISTVKETLEACSRAGLTPFCARVDGQQDLWNLDLKQGAAVVLGNEAEGLGGEWPKDTAFKISMSDEVDSLNLSISAAVTLYEACRQRKA